MKGTHIVRYRAVLRDEGPGVGRTGYATRTDTPGVVMFVPDGMEFPQYVLTGEHRVRRLVPRKSPPTPPPGWTYFSPESVSIIRAGHRGGNVIAENSTCVATAGAWAPDADELVVVAKFLKRLARWHARKTT